MAHITLVTAGSRGDIQPYIALGMGLQNAGHRATLATHGIYAGWITDHGLGIYPVEGDPVAMAQGQAGRQWMETGRRGIDLLRGFGDFMRPILREATSDLLAACAASDPHTDWVG